MTLDALIVVLIIFILYFVWWTSRSSRSPGLQGTPETSNSEKFVDYSDATGLNSSGPAFTSGASMRIAETRVTDLSGDWRTKFGEQEGDWYARHMIHRNPSFRGMIEDPTYRTATTF